MSMVEFSARVPRADYEKFSALLGSSYGATAWFIRNALRAFNEEMEGQPEMAARVKASVEKMIEDSRKG